jgi:hypothetical protein
VPLSKLHRVVSVVPLLLFAPLSAFAQSPSSVGVVTALSGSADVVRASQPRNPEPLKFRDALFLQDRIRTKEESLVRVLLGGKAVLTIRERTELTITEDPGRPTIVEVSSGKIALGVARQRMKPGEAIEVRTPNAIAAVRGTFLIVEVAPAPTAQTGPSVSTFATAVHVLTGIVDVTAGAQQIRVAHLQSVTATGANLGQLRQLTPAAAQQLTQKFSRSPQASAPPQHTQAPPVAVQRALVEHQVDQFNLHGRAITGVDAPGERDLAKAIKRDGHDKDGPLKDKVRKRPNGDDATVSSLANGSTSDLGGNKTGLTGFLGGGTAFLGGGMTGTNLGGGIGGLQTGGAGTGTLRDIPRQPLGIIKDGLKR